MFTKIYKLIKEIKKMNMATFCKKSGMNYEQFQNYESNIKKAAEAMIIYIKQNYKTDNGVYHDINEIFPYNGAETETYYYILQEMKNQGVEFYDNNKYWRL